MKVTKNNFETLFLGIVIFSIISSMIFIENPKIFLSIIVVTFTILHFLFFHKNKLEMEDSKLIQNFLNLFNSMKKKKFLNFFLLFLILFSIFATQFAYLEYETIDWDVNTYLVVSNDIINGNLPYENEWDDKGPFLYLTYSLFNYLSSGSLVLFKALNNFLFLVVVVNLYLSIYLFSNYKSHSKSIFGSLLFILSMAAPWGTVEYSELIGLFYLSISILFLNLQNKKLVYLSGIFFGIATLVNQGIGVFLIPLIYQLIKKENPKKSIMRFLISFLTIHCFMMILYFVNGLIKTYFVTLFIVPLSYVASEVSLYTLLKELWVFSKSILDFNVFVFVTFIFISTILFLSFSKKTFWFVEQKLFSNTAINLFVLSSLLFYVLGSTGYYHHLIFSLYFICLSVSLIQNFKSEIIFIIFVLISLFTTLPKTINNSIENFNSLNSIQENYPLYQLSQEIDSYFEDDYSLISLDHQLINFYLKKPNSAYVIHSTNYKEYSIINNLERFGLMEEKLISFIIESEPDVVVCSSLTKTYIDEISCEMTEFNNKYISLNTERYFNDNLRTYYGDPFREIYVYIKVTK